MTCVTHHQDEAGPLGEAKEDEEAESPVAQASEIMLTTEASQVDAAAGGGDDAQNLPNVPERAADGEEGGEGDDAEEEDADEEEEEEEEAGDGDDMIEKLLMKSTGTKRLPSLSPEDKRRVAMHLMQTTLSEYAPSALEAGEAINSHKHQTIRANTPYEADEQTIAEGFNMQLQEWYTASLEQHFAHSLMSQSYRRLYLVRSCSLSHNHILPPIMLAMAQWLSLSLSPCLPVSVCGSLSLSVSVSLYLSIFLSPLRQSNFPESFVPVHRYSRLPGFSSLGLPRSSLSSPRLHSKPGGSALESCLLV